jgi:flagellar motility protein MotE (MotC chaperone)
VKLLPLIIGLKVGLALAAGAVWAAVETGLDKSLFPSRSEVSMKSKAVEDAASVNKTSSDFSRVPELPPMDAGLSDYTKIRQQLETMRQDVEEKLVRLRLSAQNLESLRKDSAEKLALLKQEQQLLDETLQKEKTVKAERIDQALVFVEKMEPRKAAPVLEAMDRDLVIELFKRFNPKTVTKFLETMNPRKATEYMEYYTRIRSGREYELLRDLKVCATTEIPENEVSTSTASVPDESLVDSSSGAALQPTGQDDAASAARPAP